jgi:predicted  nucleic acid-binding Zn-ribbon protein
MDAALKSSEERLEASLKEVKELQAELEKARKTALATAQKVNELQQATLAAATPVKTEASKKPSRRFWNL